MTPSKLALTAIRRLLSSAAGDGGILSCRLSSRGVVRFAGPDTARFLQGLLTNDVFPLVAGAGAGGGSQPPTPNAVPTAPAPVYAAYLTPQGRFLYDFFLYKAPEREGMEGQGVELLADVDAGVADEVVQSFNKSRLRSKVQIDNVSTEFSCWQRFGSKLSTYEATVEDPEVASIGWGNSADHSLQTAAEACDLGWEWFKDPRLNCLGYRGIFPSHTIPPLVQSDNEADERHYLLWRLKRGIAEGSAEIPKGEAIPLEYNLAALNAISFEKGCYTGQELIARTHHRGVIRKRLLPFKFVDENGRDVEQAVSPGSEIVDGDSGKKVGTVSTALGSLGMGLLRLEEAFRGSSNLRVAGMEGVRVDVVRPEWWPAEWIPSPAEPQTRVA